MWRKCFQLVIPSKIFKFFMSLRRFPCTMRWETLEATVNFAKFDFFNDYFASIVTDNGTVFL